MLLQLEAQDFLLLQSPETAPGAGGILSILSPPEKGQLAADLLEQLEAQPASLETAPGAAALLHEEAQSPLVAPGEAVLQHPSVLQQDPLVAPGAASVVLLLLQPVRTKAAARAAAVKMVFMENSGDNVEANDSAPRCMDGGNDPRRASMLDGNHPRMQRQDPEVRY